MGYAAALVERQRKQKIFKIIWHKGKDSKADYFTKHHAIVHHRHNRPKYVRDNA